MKTKLIALIMLFTIILLHKAEAEYVTSELLIIPWGNNTNEIQIDEPYREYYDGPDYDTIGFMVHGSGPIIQFVDKYDNTYILSKSPTYCRGFHADGSLLVDYSPGSQNFDYNSYFGFSIQNFYIDSLCRLYFGCAFKNQITVVDTLYKLIDKISPVQEDSTENIRLSSWGSEDMLSISTRNHGCFIYKNGQFYEGGTFYGWLAIDGYYYYLCVNDDSSYHTIRYEPPRSKRCYAEECDTLFSFDMNDLYECDFLGVDNDTVLYVVYTSKADTMTKYVRLYTKDGHMVDQFALLPQVENHYLYYIYEPFFRADGCIFQFLCQDDGLHVIKWSKQ